MITAVWRNACLVVNGFIIDFNFNPVFDTFGFEVGSNSSYQIIVIGFISIEISQIVILLFKEKVES